MSKSVRILQSYLKYSLGRKQKLISEESTKPLPKRNKTTTKSVPESNHESITSSESKDDQDKNPGQCWLMKAEPETRIVKGQDVKFSIDDLASMPNQISPWEGVRNYEARNIMRDRMKLGDKVLFYHSNCKVPGVAGIAKIVKEGYPDDSAKDPNHPYYDSKTPPDQPPKWFRVDIQFVSKFESIISLKELKKAEHQEALSKMTLLNRAQLSVQPVSEQEFDYISSLGTLIDKP